MRDRHDMKEPKPFSHRPVSSQRLNSNPKDWKRERSSRRFTLLSFEGLFWVSRASVVSGIRFFGIGLGFEGFCGFWVGHHLMHDRSWFLTLVEGKERPQRADHGAVLYSRSPLGAPLMKASLARPCQIQNPKSKHFPNSGCTYP